MAAIAKAEPMPKLIQKSNWFAVIVSMTPIPFCHCVSTPRW